MHATRSRGFTLIELLVVIAIIGILSAVVLASLSTARNKGQDAGVQANLNSIQQEAEIYFSGAGSNSYGSPRAQAGCPTTSGTTMFYLDPNIRAAILAANQASGGTVNGSGVTSNVSCAATANPPLQYAVVATLVNGVTVSGITYKVWCVDNSGNSVPEVTLGTGWTVCPIPPQ